VRCDGTDVRGDDAKAARPGELAYPAVLLAAFACVFAWLAIAPTYRQDWLLENMLVLAAILGLVATHRRFRFSNTSYTLIFLLFVLHEIGAHYTYSLVPYDAWLARLGWQPSEWFGFERNHYDRLVHFAYGLLMLRPAIELLHEVAPPTGVWRGILPCTFILSHSVIYELIEWAAAVVFGGDLGMAYLGTQGDEWDAQKDMACAATGALIATMVPIVASRAAARRLSRRRHTEMRSVPRAMT
jgi:putative membrane protein